MQKLFIFEEFCKNLPVPKEVSIYNVILETIRAIMVLNFAARRMLIGRLAKFVLLVMKIH